MHVGNKTHQPFVSEYFESKQPSAVRLAGLKYAQRTDDVALVNGAIGNVSLPMHPRMIERLKKMAQLLSCAQLDPLSLYNLYTQDQTLIGGDRFSLVHHKPLKG